MAVIVICNFQGSLSCNGFGILPPQITYAPGLVSLEQRKQMLQDWRSRLEGVFQESPVPFPKMSDFQQVERNSSKGYELPENYCNSQDPEMKQGGSILHHMGRGIKPDQL